MGERAAEIVPEAGEAPQADIAERKPAEEDAERAPQPTAGTLEGPKVGIDDAQIAFRKEFLEFGDDDVERLTSMHELARRYAEPVIEDFYRHLLSFEEGRAFFRDPEVLERVKRAQKEYFLGLTRGEYGPDYVGGRLRIGAIHERINLPFTLYLGMFNWYLREIARRVFEELKGEPDKALETFLSFSKLIFLDISLAIDAYTSQRERTIRAQQEDLRKSRDELEARVRERTEELARANEALQAELGARKRIEEGARALSTPVLPVREQLLVVPLVGVLDTPRARQLTEQLLGAIRTYRARAVVIDITGVPVVDSRVANHLLQTVDAARLMGAFVIVSGLSSEVAQTLVRIGVDLSRLQTVGDLQAGLEEAERALGYDVVRGETEAGKG